MPSLYPIVLLFALCYLAPLTAEEQRSPMEWLEQMRQATSALDYHGVVVYLHHGRLETMRLEHDHHNGVERERLISLDGKLREVRRDGGSVLCILPGDRASTKGHIKGLLSVPPAELLNYYRFSLGSQERVAGRLAQQLKIEPLDRFRYGLQLHLDAEHALPLKTELMDEQGRSISQLMFTQIHFEAPPVAPSDTSQPQPKDTSRTALRLAAMPYDEATTRWRFTNLPQGFSARLHMLKEKPSKEMPDTETPKGKDTLEHFVISDGLATLSVYIEPAGEKGSGLQGGSRKGAVSVFGRLVDHYQITVVGESPQETVQAVALAVDRAEAE